MRFPFGSKNANEAPVPSAIDTPLYDCRQELDLTVSVTNFVKAHLSDRDSLIMFAGCVFAMQQDIKLASGGNLWNDTNIIRPMFNEQGIRLPGADIRWSFLDRAKLIDALQGIANVNADFVENYATTYKDNRPAHLSAEQLEAFALLAGLRNKAAALWLLTIMPYARDSMVVPLSVTNSWLILSMVKVEELLPAAKNCTGGIFDGIKCQGFSTADWPDIQL